MGMITNAYYRFLRVNSFHDRKLFGAGTVIQTYSCISMKIKSKDKNKRNLNAELANAQPDICN